MKILDFDLLHQALPNLDLPADALERMEQYAQALLETNAHMNLTAITDPRSVTLKHFADSLSLLGVYDFPQGTWVLDLGTGGGFPGVPLLLARPDLKVTFLDATRKKLRFIEETLNNMNIAARFIHARAEESCRSGSTERGAYDIVTARAVAALPVLCGYALPFLRKGGIFLAMKGPAVQDEINEAKAYLHKSGATVVDCVCVDLPDDCGERWIVVIKNMC